jgi:hypothetical protein
MEYAPPRELILVSARQCINTELNQDKGVLVQPEVSILKVTNLELFAHLAFPHFKSFKNSSENP